MKAVRHHTSCKWLLLYIERWLTVSVQQGDGTLRQRTKGTPQGGVISPLLANLFLHYASDRWMTFTNFTPAMARSAATALRQEVRSWRLQLKSDKSLEDLSRIYGPKIARWIAYYTRFYASTFEVVARYISRHHPLGDAEIQETAEVQNPGNGVGAQRCKATATPIPALEPWLSFRGSMMGAG